MNSSTYRRLAVVALAPFACVTGQVLAAGAVQDVIVFGDSLSGPGNVFALTGVVSIAPDAAIVAIDDADRLAPGNGYVGNVG